MNKICEYGCLECGMPIYNYEVDLLDGLCPKCYDKYFKIAIGNGCKKSSEILRNYYRNEFEREINK